MSKLNKTQIYAIRWLANQGTTQERIAAELDLNIEQVIKTLEKYGSSDKSNAIEEKQSPVKQSSMITETSGKRTKNVAIMTKEASEQHDAARHKTQTVNNNENSIFRPKSNG
jgi:hypothetical protein